MGGWFVISSLKWKVNLLTTYEIKNKQIENTEEI